MFPRYLCQYQDTFESILLFWGRPCLYCQNRFLLIIKKMREKEEEWKMFWKEKMFDQEAVPCESTHPSASALSNNCRYRESEHFKSVVRFDGMELRACSYLSIAYGEGWGKKKVLLEWTRTCWRICLMMLESVSWSDLKKKKFPFWKSIRIRCWRSKLFPFSLPGKWRQCPCPWRDLPCQWDPTNLRALCNSTWTVHWISCGRLW